MDVNRRTLVGAVAAAALGTLATACSSPSQTPARARTGPATRVGSLPTATRPEPAPETSAQERTAPLPTRAQIEARYAGQVPTAWGLAVPGVMTRLPRPGHVVALTFDACGGPGGDRYDAALIAVLRAEGVKATLFLNQRWIAANPAVFRDLAHDPLFAIGNHGTRHLPLSVTGRAAYGIPGTRSAGEVHTEVVANAVNLRHRLGHLPTLFRSGTAHYDDVATRIVHDLGMTPVGFDVNGDAGATFTPAQVVAAMRGVRPGSIVIAHMNQPGHGTAAGMRETLPRLKAAGYEFVHLHDHVP